MTSRVCTILSVAIICLALPVSAADWPQFRGPRADGHSPETGINKAWNEKPPQVLWKVPLSDGGYAGPSAADGTVFIIDHKEGEDVLRALDINTGQERWSFSHPEGGGSNRGFARSTPTIDDGKVYTLSRSGMLHCLKAADGTKIWARNIIADFKGTVPSWLMSMSPVVDGEKLIVTPAADDALVAALDKNTGETIWQTPGDSSLQKPTQGPFSKISYATPVVATVAGKKQYVIFTASSAIGVDSENGELLWRFPWQTKYDVNAAMPLVIGNHVFITSGYGHGCALLRVGPGKAEAVWQNKEMAAHFNSPLLHQGYIYGTGDPDHLMCLEPKTGKCLWKQKGFEKGGIVAVDGTIIGLNGRGGDVIVAEMTPKGYRELGRITPLGGQSWTPPIVADGKLIIRNKQALACIDLK